MKKTIIFIAFFLFGWTIVSGVRIEKALQYNQHTLKDHYKYKKTVRQIQWNKISQKLDSLLILEEIATEFGALNNYKNKNGLAPLVNSFKHNAYKHVVDKNGTKRDQGIPFYRTDNLSAPECYGKDGALVWILRDSADYLVIVPAEFDGVWLVPSKYVDRLPVRRFTKTIFVDRTNQNIVTLEQTDTAWLVRSMNPATTGVRRPPYRQETPTGIFVVRSKTTSMMFTKDGNSELAGYAPWASRFSGGGYIHGVPVNYPNKKVSEFSWSLGTVPRSHMCVRSATSHSKFIYDWASTDRALIIIYD